jgi:hypothetical protein
MTKLNAFQTTVQDHQVKWRRDNKSLLQVFGLYQGKEYEHLFPADQWLLGVWEPIRHGLDQYIEAVGIQPHTQKHNLKSSWIQSANAFFPFKMNADMRRMLCSFLSRQLNLKISSKVSSIEAIEFEYSAPGRLEPKRLLGEQGGTRGSNQTSPDVAILFGCDDGRSGIYLIENKYTEHHFYGCSAAKKTLGSTHKQQGLPPNTNPERCNDLMGILEKPQAMCQQETWNRHYWKILWDTFDPGATETVSRCPAMKDGYQLFRQQALAQGIAYSGLFDIVVSGVAYDERNAPLIQCLKDVGINDFAQDWGDLFQTDVIFHCFTHQDLISWVTRSTKSFGKQWGKYMNERYDYGLQIRPTKG